MHHIEPSLFLPWNLKKVSLKGRQRLKCLQCSFVIVKMSNSHKSSECNANLFSSHPSLVTSDSFSASSLVMTFSWWLIQFQQGPDSIGSFLWPSTLYPTPSSSTISPPTSDSPHLFSPGSTYMSTTGNCFLSSSSSLFSPAHHGVPQGLVLSPIAFWHLHDPAWSDYLPPLSTVPLLCWWHPAVSHRNTKLNTLNFLKLNSMKTAHGCRYQVAASEG